MKILWFNWRCWLNPAMGGAEVFTREVAKRLVQAGHEVTLFSSRFEGCKNEETLDGISVVRSGGRLSVYWKARYFYQKRLRASGFDVVIDEINTVPFFTPKFVDKETRIIALIHQLAREYWFYEMPFPLGHIGYHYLEEKWLKNYFGVPTITVSESSRRDLLELGFRKVGVVPEGLNFEPHAVLPKLQKTPVLAYVGRLGRAKRPDHAIKAFKIVKEHFPEAELWLLGDGPFRKALEKKTTIEGVRYFGNLPDDKRRSLLSKAWVMVNPSVREGWGLNIIEANALGVPSVAYDVPGLRDSVKHESTGLLAEAGNIEDLAEKIIRLLGNKMIIQKLRGGSLEYSKGFSWDNTASEFMFAMENI